MPLGSFTIPVFQYTPHPKAVLFSAINLNRIHRFLGIQMGKWDTQRNHTLKLSG